MTRVHRTLVDQQGRQTEIGHLHAAAEKHDILGLDIAMKNRDPGHPVELVPGLMEEVDHVGRLAQGFKQLSHGDSCNALLREFPPAIPERSVSEFHAEDEQVIGGPGTKIRQEIGVPDRAQDSEIAQLAPSEPAGGANQLECDRKAAGGLGTPDLARAAKPDPLQQTITRDRFIPAPAHCQDGASSHARSHD
jgi:hypothetical protein